jgi:hypothetical protein
MRVRFAAAALAPLIVLAIPTIALSADFSHMRCDTPRFEADIMARLGHGKSDATGRLMSTRFDYGPITSATTLVNTGNRITCKITVMRNDPGGMKSIHGIFTATLGATGRSTWHWEPNG